MPVLRGRCICVWCQRSEPQKLEKEEVMSLLMWVLGTELGSPQRTEPVLLTNELRSFPLLDQSGLELGDPSNFWTLGLSAWTTSAWLSTLLLALQIKSHYPGSLWDCWATDHFFLPGLWQGLMYPQAVFQLKYAVFIDLDLELLIFLCVPF